VALPAAYLLVVAELVNEGVSRLAAPALRPFIERYRGYRLSGFPAGIHKGMPSRHMAFMFSFDQPLETATGGSYWAFVGGLHTRAVDIVHDGTEHGIAVQLTPLGARTAFGLPAGALAGTVAHLDELLGPAATELYDRLAAATDWGRRFNILDEVLLRHAAQVDDPAGTAPEVVRAWQQLVSTGGRIRVNDLAAEVGWSRRHLSERFRAEIGLTPKEAARVVRFERARNLLSLPTRPGLAAVAAECGYADQAHFTREFGEVVGLSPTRWIANELPFMQDGE